MISCRHFLNNREHLFWFHSPPLPSAKTSTLLRCYFNSIHYGEFRVPHWSLQKINERQPVVPDWHSPLKTVAGHNMYIYFDFVYHIPAVQIVRCYYKTSRRHSTRTFFSSNSASITDTYHPDRINASILPLPISVTCYTNFSARPSLLMRYSRSIY